MRHDRGDRSPRRGQESRPSTAGSHRKAQSSWRPSIASPPRSPSLTGDLANELRAFLTNVARLCNDENFGPHLAALIGETQHDPTVGDALLERYLKPRRPAVAERLAAAQRRGQISDRLDLHALLEVTFGVLYHRLRSATGRSMTATRPSSPT